MVVRTFARAIVINASEAGVAEGRRRDRKEIDRNDASSIHPARVPHWTFIGVISLIVGDRFITSTG